MKDYQSTLWQKFLKSGRIDDYLKYKFYVRKKEARNYEENRTNGGLDSQE